jgi:hypothetical protein
MYMGMNLSISLEENPTGSFGQIWAEFATLAVANSMRKDHLKS